MESEDYKKDALQIAENLQEVAVTAVQYLEDIIPKDILNSFCNYRIDVVEI